MSDPRLSDEGLLIDLLLGRCEPDTRQAVLRRLDRDEAFRQLHVDLGNTFRALSLAVEAEPPADLAERTLARIEAARKTEALIAREELSRPAAIRATFSFREMVAAAAAVLLLAVVFVPSLHQARSASRIAECGAQVGRIGTGLMAYANMHGGFLPAVEGASSRWLAGPSAASNSQALFKLINDRYVQSPVDFQCPAVGGSSFEVKAGMADFPASKYISYSYQHMLGSHRMQVEQSPQPEMSANLAILADASPIFAEGRFHPERLQAKGSDNHGGAGQNVLYLDAHVAWANTPEVGVQGDNIYLVRGVNQYRGDEAPADDVDSFLLPSCSVTGQ